MVPGLPHHVTHRGNRGDPVFFSALDRERYLSLFQLYARENDLQISAYCLMTNHVHFVVVPQNMFSLARTMGIVHMRHTQRVNKLKGWSGHLWGNRFFSTLLDWEHFRAAVRYVERNPVRAAIVDRAEGYHWSSAKAHVLKSLDPLLSKEALFGLDEEMRDWSDWLGEGDGEEIEMLRDRIKTCRPCGSDSFVDMVKSELNWDLVRQRWGNNPSDRT